VDIRYQNILLQTGHLLGKQVLINEEANPPYNVQEFQYIPGIYFEKIGRLREGNLEVCNQTRPNSINEEV